ncbi:probable LRR receptor-like serine/threonine-protein kinase At1g06840 isoform X2 [Carya illinoinensis]|uniref:probable LRR receptor-like serine/threonine-protein kinase At1g06840 isoform X2 n=1 Tax=Carya illinoinensis TaxID=32201 RepID=UPI001C728C6E|nr:probable LRR receptor-like serine/threonine-protein kinase At1g06840 isoform X2 [Carya illinoinensis]
MSKSTAWKFGIFVVAWLCWTSLSFGAQGAITDPVEVTALLAIKRSLIDPNKILGNWNRGDPCTSSWIGVVCLEDGYLHVQQLLLLKMGLSGSLSPELGKLLYLEIMDFMWNSISGSIPMEIGNITNLKLLLLNGNKLTGTLPEELGYLPNLERIHIHQNNISGPIPVSFVNLNKTKYFYMNNNSISGQIPPELSRLSSLVHFLLDNNNLSGYLPPQFSELPSLVILQLDNNDFGGTTIPASYSRMSKLRKLSLRNCNLQGKIPALSLIPNLGYLDLSLNLLNGTIDGQRLSEAITSICLSNNSFTGTIPVSFSNLPRLQILSIANNSLNGSIPSTIWQDRALNGNGRLTVELQNNKLSNITGDTNLPPYDTVWLQGNPLCSNTNLVSFCGSESDAENKNQGPTNNTSDCQLQCPPPYEPSPRSPKGCFCAAPLLVGYRLKSPGFSDFRPYISSFKDYLTSGLDILLYQLYIDSFEWEEGPRLKMYLKLFPVYNDIRVANLFNTSEVRRIRNMFTSWSIIDSEIFGPYELLNFTLLDIYKDDSNILTEHQVWKQTLIAVTSSETSPPCFLKSRVRV